MQKTFTVIVEKGEDENLIASVVEIPGCRTQAKTHEILMERIREAIVLCEEENKLSHHSRFLSLQQVQI